MADIWRYNYVILVITIATVNIFLQYTSNRDKYAYYEFKQRCRSIQNNSTCSYSRNKSQEYLHCKFKNNKCALNIKDVRMKRVWKNQSNTFLIANSRRTEYHPKRHDHSYIYAILACLFSLCLARTYKRHQKRTYLKGESNKASSSFYKLKT